MAEVYQLDAVDVPPEFPGGNNAMVCYINNEMRYPRQALDNGTCGRVLCGFIVNSDGKVSDVTVIRRVSPELDREAVRVIESMPRWNAAQVEGQNVPVFYMLPVNFRL
ncbi:MAG: energy transducer TonB [Muribaculaceae bacterium]|nr:energy transducer TonB [Muribaculaceae bacterium]